MPPLPPVIAFDLDGTLVDTAPDLLGALDHVLGDYGLPPVDRDALRSRIGIGARAMIVGGLERVGIRLPDETVTGLHRRFLAYYGENIAVGSRPYPGMEAALDRLSARGFALAVCTNKPEALARKLLDALRLSQRFATLTGADTYARPKPDPETLFATIAAAGGEAARAVMVGDSTTDIATARAARVPSVAVSFGYSEVPPEHLGATALIRHYDELEAALDAVLKG